MEPSALPVSASTAELSLTQVDPFVVLKATELPTTMQDVVVVQEIPVTYAVPDKSVR